MLCFDRRFVWPFWVACLRLVCFLLPPVDGGGDDTFLTYSVKLKHSSGFLNLMTNGTFKTLEKSRLEASFVVAREHLMDP